MINLGMSKFVIKRTVKAVFNSIGFDIVRHNNRDHQSFSISRPLDVAVIGPYTVHNFGDDLIGAILIKHLLNKKKGIFQGTIPNLSLQNSEWLGTLSSENVKVSAQNARTLLIGGGGIFGSNVHNVSDHYLKRAIDAIAWKGPDCQKIVINGVGAGPFPNSHFQSLIQEICSAAIKIGVRDQESAYLLINQLHVPEEKIVTGADVALLWPEVLPVQPRSNGLIGVQCNTQGYSINSDTHQEKFIHSLFADFSRSYKQETVILSPLANSSPIRDPLELFPLHLNYQFLPEFLTHLGGLKAIITTHLHLSIAAFAARIPCFSVYVHEKTRRFYSQIGREKFAISLEEADKNSVLRLFELARSASWSESDEKHLQKAKKEAMRLLEISNYLLSDFPHS